MIRRLHVRNWGPRFYLTIFALLLVLNLLGPSGLVHLILVRQELDRATQILAQKHQERAAIQDEIDLFKSSDVFKQRMIREHLGLLLPHEVSFELNLSKATQ